MSLTIRTRLAVWHVALLTVILAAFGAFLLLRLKTDLVASIDRSLNDRAAQISLGYEGGGEGEFQDVSDASLVRLPQGEHGAQILSPGGTVLEASGDTVAHAPMLDRAALADVLHRHRVRTSVALGADREPFRVLAIPAPARPGDVLVVATSLDELGGSVHRLLVLLLIAGPAAVGAAALVGWWVARKALRPVARMTAQAEEIGVDRLHERVAVPPVDDELGRLARTLNDMLDRLEEGVAAKHRLVADASHELRTPLAVMRSELDVSLRSDHLSAEAREVLESTEEEVERMTRIVENLLMLARIDDGRLPLLPARTDLGDVTFAVAEDLRPLAEAKGVRMEVEDGGAPVTADRDRLYQAVANLVDNAVKYTEPGGKVRVEAWRNRREAGVTVTDTGPGIPREVLPRVFDRFFRGDGARSMSNEGSGLGLAICQEIVRAHGGRVWAESEPGLGSSFSLALPLHASEQEPASRVPSPSA